MRDLDVDVKMFSATPGGAFPDYAKALEKTAEFAYAGSFWDPGLPYPGNPEFVAAYQKEFTRDPSLGLCGGLRGLPALCGRRQAGRRSGL